MIAYADYRERVDAPGPKRLLALDGGGIRGLISIEILLRLEQQLRQAFGNPELVLADYFDYVAGTSTGAIIATGISLGMAVEEIRDFYRRGARVIFKPAPFFQRWWYHRLRATGLTAALRHELGDTRLGDPGLPVTGEARVRTLRALLLVVMYRCDTDSPWPLSNNPKAKYNQGSEADGNNLYLPLWKLVRASSAAPTYFPPEEIMVGSRRCIFADGAVTPYNNPAFLLYLMATFEAYNLGWERGEDRLLLVSVGTGSIPSANPSLKARQMNMLYNAKAVPSALIYAATVEADKLCRVFGRCLKGERIDSEIGTLEEPLSKPPSRPKDFTYVRYDPNLTEAGLKGLGVFPRIRPELVLPLISGKHLEQLEEVGRTYADKFVFLADFGAFDPQLVQR